MSALRRIPFLWFSQGWRASLVGVAAIGLATLLVAELGSSYQVFILDSVLLAVIGASALNLLMGTVGQVSIGNAAFLVVGAFTAVISRQAHIAFPLDLVPALLAGAAVGFVVGLPALRIQGVYLALTTLAANFIFVEIAQRYQSVKVGAGGFIMPRLFTGMTLADQYRAWAALLFVAVALVLVLLRTLTAAELGRAWRLIRDHELVGPTLGMRASAYKLGAFMLSSALVALQGALAAHFSGYVSADSFTLTLAISYVAMVLIGGPDSQLGAVLGALIVVWLPFACADLLKLFPAASPTVAPQIALIAYGALVVFFITFAPSGVAGWLQTLWARISGPVPVD